MEWRHFVTYLSDDPRITKSMYRSECNDIHYTSF